MDKTTRQKATRRYYLHYRLRKAGYTVRTSKKTIEVPGKEFESKSTPEPYKSYLTELYVYGYAIQSVII